MLCTSTKYLRNFWSFHRQCSRYKITLSQVNTDIHAILRVTQMLSVRKDPISNITLKVSHSESHCSIVWYHSLIRHYNCHPDTSSLLQATERTARWWVKCAKFKSRYPYDVWSACNSERMQSRMQLVRCLLTFLPKNISAHFV